METNKVVKVGESLSKEAKQVLIQFLWERMKSFAWTYKDMREVDPSVMMYKLSVDPTRRPVRQRRRACALREAK